MTENENENDVRRTTVRAKVTRGEHDAVKRTAHLKLGMTIEDFVRDAVDRRLQETTGKSLAELSEEITNKPKWVQGELF